MLIRRQIDIINTQTYIEIFLYFDKYRNRYINILISIQIYRCFHKYRYSFHIHLWNRVFISAAFSYRQFLRGKHITCCLSNSTIIVYLNITYTMVSSSVNILTFVNCYCKFLKLKLKTHFNVSQAFYDSKSLLLHLHSWHAFLEHT